MDMQKPYAQLHLYFGLVDSRGLSEGKFGREAYTEGGRVIEQNRMMAAHSVINECLDTGRVRFGHDHIVDSFEHVDEVITYIVGAVPGSEQQRELYDVAHGKLRFNQYLLIPGFKKRNSGELVEILLGAPHQPEIDSTKYTVTEIMGKKVDERRERSRLWRAVLKFAS